MSSTLTFGFSCTVDFFGNRCEQTVVGGGGDTAMWVTISIIALIAVIASMAFGYYKIKSRYRGRVS